MYLASSSTYVYILDAVYSYLLSLSWQLSSFVKVISMQNASRQQHTGTKIAHACIHVKDKKEERSQFVQNSSALALASQLALFLVMALVSAD